MSLWEWVADFPVPPVAIPATAATDAGDGTEPSQLSQMSQWVGGEATGQGRPELSQPSQQSQPFGDAELHGSEAAREAYEERAAIMEFDGGMTRAEAERLAASLHLLPPEPPPVPLSERGVDASDMGDLRPCTWCRNLSPAGRCQSAWRGELRAARDYSPTYPDQPRRCIGYWPGSRDPDLDTGRERWPELLEWQSPVRDSEPSEGSGPTSPLKQSRIFK